MKISNKLEKLNKQKRLKTISLLFAMMLILLGATACLGVKSYAYTKEEIAAAKAWLSSHGYSPDRGGANQAYQDYLNGKFDPNNSGQTDPAAGGEQLPESGENGAPPTQNPETQNPEAQNSETKNPALSESAPPKNAPQSGAEDDAKENALGNEVGESDSSEGQNTTGDGNSDSQQESQDTGESDVEGKTGENLKETDSKVESMNEQEAAEAAIAVFQQQLEEEEKIKAQEEAKAREEQQKLERQKAEQDAAEQLKEQQELAEKEAGQRKIAMICCGVLLVLAVVGLVKKLAFGKGKRNQ